MVIATRTRGKPPLDEEDLYPSSDGEPMGETDFHVEATLHCLSALQLYFADSPQVYVAGDNFIYFQEGNPKKVVSPDCYVVFGAAKKLRKTYMTWKEGGILPSVVIEITSKKTRKEDTGKKLTLYEQVLQAPEYFLFDPTHDYLKPPLQGYRLVNGRYEPIPYVNDRLHSEQLGLDLMSGGQMLRLFDPIKGEVLPTYPELAQRAAQESQERREAVQRAEEAEAENARLRAQLEALRNGDADTNFR